MIHSQRSPGAARRGVAVAALAAGCAAAPFLGGHVAARADGSTLSVTRDGTGRQGAPEPDASRPVPHRKTAPAHLDPVGSAATGRVPARGTYRWWYEVSNSGGAPARHVVLTVVLPENLVFIAAPRRCSWHGRRVWCRIGALAPGERLRGEITAAVAPTTEPGTRLRPTADVTWSHAGATNRRPVTFPEVAAGGMADGDDVSGHAPARGGGDAAFGTGRPASADGEPARRRQGGSAHGGGVGAEPNAGRGLQVRRLPLTGREALPVVAAALGLVGIGIGIACAGRRGRDDWRKETC